MDVAIKSILGRLEAEKDAVGAARRDPYCDVYLASLLGQRNFPGPPRYDGLEALVLAFLDSVQNLRARVKHNRHQLCGVENMRLVPLSLSVRQYIFIAPPAIVEMIYERLYTRDDRTSRRGLVASVFFCRFLEADPTSLV